MNTAVVKLDPLPDTVRPPAQDHYLLFLGYPRFVLLFVCRIKVRCIRLKLRCARVNELVCAFYFRVFAQFADCSLFFFKKMGELHV